MHKFTLVELLVVIAIISILASLLLPALQSAQQEAVAAQCISNFKNIGIATALYQDSNNDYFPYRGHDPYDAASTLPRWYNLLENYTGTYVIFNCPAVNLIARGSIVTDVPTTSAPGWNTAWGTMPRGRAVGGYICNSAINSAQFGSGKIWAARFTTIEQYTRIVSSSRKPNSNQIVYVADGVDNVYNHSKDLAAAGGIINERFFVHSQRRNILYVDGHAQLNSMDDLMICTSSNSWNASGVIDGRATYTVLYTK